MQSYNNSNNAHCSFHIIQQLKKEDFTINVKLALQPPPLLRPFNFSARRCIVYSLHVISASAYSTTCSNPKQFSRGGGG